MLAVLMMFDLTYMVVSITFKPILILLFVCCKLDLFQQYEEIITIAADYLFKMSYMDVQGFRL